jgi:hypothetical protein
VSHRNRPPHECAPERAPGSSPPFRRPCRGGARHRRVPVADATGYIPWSLRLQSGSSFQVLWVLPLRVIQKRRLCLVRRAGQRPVIWPHPFRRQLQRPRHWPLRPHPRLALPQCRPNLGRDAEIHLPHLPTLRHPSPPPHPMHGRRLPRGLQNRRPSGRRTSECGRRSGSAIQHAPKERAAQLRQ